MMAEGIATWISVKICDISEDKAFWGNFLSEAKIAQWPDNITVNCIAPGPVQTGWIDTELEKQVIKVSGGHAI